MAGVARRGVGGAWRQDAERWLNWSGADRSRGVPAEPVALQPPGSGATTPFPEAGVRKHPAPEGALRRSSHLSLLRCQQWSESTQQQKVHYDDRRTGRGREQQQRQKAPSTRRCIKTLRPCRCGCGCSMSESTQHQKAIHGNCRAVAVNSAGKRPVRPLAP